MRSSPRPVLRYAACDRSMYGAIQLKVCDLAHIAARKLTTHRTAPRVVDSFNSLNVPIGTNAKCQTGCGLVCFAGQTGSDRCTVRTTRLTPFRTQAALKSGSAATCPSYRSHAIVHGVP